MGASFGAPRGIVPLAGLLTALSVITACGSSSSSSSSVAGSSGTGSNASTSDLTPASLNFATNAVSANFAPVLAADALGYFKQEKLTVTITYTGASPLTSLVSGRADLIAFAQPAPTRFEPRYGLL